MIIYRGQLFKFRQCYTIHIIRVVCYFGYSPSSIDRRLPQSVKIEETKQKRLPVI